MAVLLSLSDFERAGVRGGPFVGTLPVPRLAWSGVARLKVDVEWLERRAIGMARREGYDWGRIGRLLGVSRQAARQRWKTTDFSDMLPSTLRRAYRNPFVDENLDRAHAAHFERERRRVDEVGDATPW